jgi:hypothetical protein
MCFLFTTGEGQVEGPKPCPFERMAKHFSKSTDLKDFEGNVASIWSEIIKFGQVNDATCVCVRARAVACMWSACKSRVVFEKFLIKTDFLASFSQIDKFEGGSLEEKVWLILNPKTFSFHFTNSFS